MTLFLGLLLFVCLGVTGCGSFLPSAEQLDALGKDPASVCLNITSVYGSVRYARTAIVNAGSMNCGNDGLSVKSDGSQIGVPILVVPQITVGQPAAPTK